MRFNEFMQLSLSLFVALSGSGGGRPKRESDRRTKAEEEM